MTISLVMQDIYKQPENIRLDYAINKYSKFFNKDIIEYLLVAHCIDYDLFEEFNFININHMLIELTSVSNKEVFDKLEYAEFCTLRDESLEDYNWLSTRKGFDFWPNGTWLGPIVVAEKNNKYVAIDGNNRLRMLRMFLKYSKKKKLKKHQLYIIKSS